MALFSATSGSCTLDVQNISPDTVSNLLVNIMEHLAGKKTDISLWSWTPRPVNYDYRQFITLSIDPGPVWMFLLQRKLFSIFQIKSRQGLDAFFQCAMKRARSCESCALSCPEGRMFYQCVGMLLYRVGFKRNAALSLNQYMNQSGNSEDDAFAVNLTGMNDFKHFVAQ